MNAEPITPAEFTLSNIMSSFATDEQARAFLERWLWPEGAVCPRCHSKDPIRVYRMTGKSTRPGLHNCKQCRRQFTVTVGTIFEDSHIPLRKWLMAWYFINASKKGMASLQLQRMLELGSYRTALFMTHRIRFALSQPDGPMLSGIVEIDETYVGGKPRVANNRDGKTHYSKKIPVVTLAERDGNKRSMVMKRVTGDNVMQAVAQYVSPKAHVMTDEASVYPILKLTHKHDTVNHSVKEYSRKQGRVTVSTNTVESSFSLLKRGVYGVFHSVSEKHLPLYIAEFDHRWNTRKDKDGERTVEGLKMAKGKRLTYKSLVSRFPQTKQ